ncbi:MAG: M3 family metallopeptidase [Bdellovibrionaceae bacterium]|nr:M3 family metallopeptidase [Pseudobdellovibrionaceae bacterium]
MAKLNRIFFIYVLLVFSVAGFAAKSTTTTTNILLTNWWAGPHGGVPPFDKVKVTDFEPAIDQGMAEAKVAIQGIANNPKPATFENTLLELEKSARVLDRVMAVYRVWAGGLNTAEFQEVEKKVSPKLAAFEDETIQNEALFKRIEAVYNSSEKAKLTPEQQRLVWYQYNNFVLKGAKLDAKQKTRVSEINQRLAQLATQFSQNQLADEDKITMVLEKESDLAGLPQPLVDAAAAEAVNQKKAGKWVLTNTRSSIEPYLTYATNRELREKAFKMWTSRGDNNNENNNNKVITEVLKLRAERSRILGYPTYAHWNLADNMAQDPAKAMDLMLQVWKPAVETVKAEVKDMQAIVDQEKGGFKVQPWDYRFYAEKVRKAKYDLDLNAVKPYLQLAQIQKGLFYTADKLFGFKFEKLNGVPVFHPEVTVYKVTKAGKMVGLWYFDPYARPGKQSGAWMSAYREQSRIDKKPLTTIVSNNSNFIKGKPGEPVLLSWDDAVTMFHEFGHALHGLNSNVTYPSLSGTNVPTDYVEFPSQVLENYLETPEVLKMLTNTKGEALPKVLIDKIEKTKAFNSGFTTVEFLASAIVDMKLHLSTETSIDPAKFEKAALKEIGMPSEIVMRHRLPAFGHLFSGEGYAAGYYSYLWSQVLDHDAYEAFVEAGNPYDKKTAQKLIDHVFSVGNTVDPAEGYRQFRGRDPKVDGLLRARGFPVPSDIKVETK